MQHLPGLKMEAYSAPVWEGKEDQFQSLVTFFALYLHVKCI